MLAASVMAVEEINGDPSILPNHVLHLTVQNYSVASLTSQLTGIPPPSPLPFTLRAPVPSFSPNTKARLPVFPSPPPFLCSFLRRFTLLPLLLLSRPLLSNPPLLFSFILSRPLPLDAFLSFPLPSLFLPPHFHVTSSPASTWQHSNCSRTIRWL
ncbi:unnamed protein product [Closterium sp. NIES-54]